jgi:uncharacterized membrane protein
MLRATTIFVVYFKLMQSVQSFYKYLLRRPELIFVLFALVFGLIYVFKLAPLRGTDEFTHFSRVYQVSDGTLWEQKIPGNKYGGPLPANVNDMINNFRVLTYQDFNQQYLSNKHELISKYSRINQPGRAYQTADFTSSYLYQPWDYTADLVGLILAKILHVPLLWYVYMARVSSLLCYVILVWLAIRILPVGKWFLTTLALVPTALTQAATVSADGLLNGLSWLIFALTLAILAKKLKLNLKMQLVLVLLMVLMCIFKSGYMLVGLFSLVIPSSYFINRRAARLWRISMVCLFALVSLVFTFISIKYVNKTPTILYPGLNVNAHEQIRYIISHPLSYLLREVWWLISHCFDIIYLGAVGLITNRIVTLPIGIILLLYLCLYLSFERSESMDVFKENARNLRLAATIILIGTYALTTTAQYINASGVGSITLNSYWGRYLLPIIPLLLIFPMTSKTFQRIKPTTKYKNLVLIIMALCLTSTLLVVN